MAHRGGHQPYRKGLARQQGAALDAMRRGAPAGRAHPSATKRALQKRAGAAIAARGGRTAIGKALSKRVHR